MPAPLAAAAARYAVRHRRRLATVAGSGVAGAWFVTMSVIVVAVGGTSGIAALVDATGIPAVALAAYQQAADSPSSEDCGLRWQILAAVGRVESNHASGRTIADDGTVTPTILGPVLDGSGDTARVLDTDGGTLDGDSRWDRAVGPMQLIPSSWRVFGADGNGDGRSDPNNFYDAALAAAGHLCGRSARLDAAAALRDALFAYNASDTYVADVLDWVAYYDTASLNGRSGIAPTGTLVTVRGITVDASIAENVETLLAAAEADGLALGGSGYRSHDDQIALRRAHCGASYYAIYDMAASACSPPTARPGESRHEAGMAIDFTCGGALITTPSSPCHTWLMANAPTYGLHPLETEPWHWSVDGK